VWVRSKSEVECRHVRPSQLWALAVGLSWASDPFAWGCIANYTWYCEIIRLWPRTFLNSTCTCFRHFAATSRETQQSHRPISNSAPIRCCPVQSAWVYAALSNPFCPVLSHLSTGIRLFASSIRGHCALTWRTTKPEVHNVSQRCHRRSKPRPYVHKIWWEFDCSSRDMLANRHADTDIIHRVKWRHRIRYDRHFVGITWHNVWS